MTARLPVQTSLKMEHLEARDCPSVSVYSADAGRTLLVQGTAANELRYVPDSGHFNQPQAVLAAVADVVQLSQPTPPTSAPTLQSTLEDLRRQTGVPALAGGVIANGQTTVAGTGVRERGKTAAVSETDRFNLGSNGKAMTATLAALLVEKGTIRWNTTVGEMFPELKGRIQPGYAAVTLEELLNHRGGFDDEKFDPEVLERFRATARTAMSGRTLLFRELLTAAPPGGVRGEFLYSNIDYGLAGAMLERAANRSFETLLAERVFAPLGMTSARFGIPPAGQPVGYDPDGQPVPDPAPNGIDLFSPAVNVSMNMADWGKFLRAHLGESVGRGRLLSDAVLAKLHTQDPRSVPANSEGTGYGFGWWKVETPQGAGLAHGGGWAGFGSLAIIVPSKGMAVYFATNQLTLPIVTAAQSTAYALLGQVATPHPVRSVLDDARLKADLPALAGGVIANGKTTIAATGVRERGKTATVTDSDQFHLGSNGKAMTSTLAAVLVEKGLVRWNTTMGEAFPELKVRIDPAQRSVTLEQLLNHRGGFRDENVDPALSERALAFRGPAGVGRAQFLPPLLKTPAGKVGEFSYSNVGYTVAAMMLERATGNNYERLMQKYIFNPLGMASAGFGPPGSAALDQPRGHTPEGVSVGNGPSAELPRIMSPAGLMHMNMADWAKFLSVHLGERVNGVKLLSDASLTKLHTADPRDADAPGVKYGFGWVHFNLNGRDVLWHNGSNGYWYSEAALDLKAKTAAFAVANQANEGASTAVNAAVISLGGQRSNSK
jgi:CubicO group peptidase (beta-lactamase class C family)